ncbi:hypothetical protein KJ830_05210 [bacterium]|nr:hypothetical protein [bacterium]
MSNWKSVLNADSVKWLLEIAQKRYRKLRAHTKRVLNLKCNSYIIYEKGGN